MTEQLEAPFNYKKPPALVKLRILRDGAELACVESGISVDDAEIISGLKPGFQAVWIRLKAKASIPLSRQLDALLAAARAVQKQEAKELQKAKERTQAVP